VAILKQRNRAANGRAFRRSLAAVEGRTDARTDGGVAGGVSEFALAGLRVIARDNRPRLATMIDLAQLQFDLGLARPSPGLFGFGHMPINRRSRAPQQYRLITSGHCRPVT